MVSIRLLVALLNRWMQLVHRKRCSSKIIPSPKINLIIDYWKLVSRLRPFMNLNEAAKHTQITTTVNAYWRFRRKWQPQFPRFPAASNRPPPQPSPRIAESLMGMEWIPTQNMGKRVASACLDPSGRHQKNQEIPNTWGACPAQMFPPVGRGAPESIWVDPWMGTQ